MEGALLEAKALVFEALDVVKYGDPILIEILNKDEIPERRLKDTAVRSVDKGFPIMPSIPGLLRVVEGGQDIFYTLDDMQTILRTMYPSRSYKFEGKLWRKHISLARVNRSDLYQLQEQLPAKTVMLGVNPLCISRIQTQLNFLYLDELIRQETLSCAERGMLLHRIREEFHLYVEIYEKLMEISDTFYTKQSWYSRDEIAEHKEELRNAEIERNELQHNLEGLDAVFNQSKRLAQLRLEADTKLYEDEMLCIKRSNQQFEMLLQSVNPTHPVLQAVRHMFLDMSRI